MKITITAEGKQGCGKTTYLVLAAKALTEAGLLVGKVEIETPRTKKGGKPRERIEFKVGKAVFDSSPDSVPDHIDHPKAG